MADEVGVGRLMEVGSIKGLLRGNESLFPIMEELIAGFRLGVWDPLAIECAAGAG
jgi:hypothetical protein